MGLWFLLVFIALIIVALVWARRVMRNHEDEALYETEPRPHDAGFLEKLGDGFHGGSGPGL